MDNHMPETHGEHHDMPMGQGKTCHCVHHKVGPILVIIVGLEFFFAEINVLTWGFVNVTWPILVVIWGIVMLSGRNCRCCDK